MNEQNNTEMTWWERNKKKVLIIGGVVIAVGIGIVVFKNKDVLIELIKKGKAAANNIPQNDEPIIIKTNSNAPTEVNIEVVAVNTPINNGEPFEVKGFIRNLPESRCPSAEKRAQAARLGIVLGEHQTLVDPYTKNAV